VFSNFFFSDLFKQLEDITPGPPCSDTPQWVLLSSWNTHSHANRTKYKVLVAHIMAHYADTDLLDIY
jgi:hypothetical protein